MKKEKINVLFCEDREESFNHITLMLDKIEEKVFIINHVKTYKAAAEQIKKEDVDLCLLSDHLKNNVGLKELEDNLIQEQAFPVILLQDHLIYPMQEKSTVEIRKSIFSGQATDCLNTTSLIPEILKRSIYYALTKYELDIKIALLSHFEQEMNMPDWLLFNAYSDILLENTKRRHLIFSIMILDITNLTILKRQAGHKNEKRIKKEISHRLKTTIGKADIVSRITESPLPKAITCLGESSFALLLAEIKHIADASRVAQRLLAVFRKPFVLNEKDTYFECSIGIALFPMDGEDKNSLIIHAHKALLHAKQKGKNRFAYYTGQFHNTALSRLKMEDGLRKALKKNLFLLYYQPQIDMKTLAISYIEAFLRWKKPGGTIITASHFIGLAEEIGLIVPIGKMLLEKICADYLFWNSKGINVPAITINLSPSQLREKTMHSTFYDIVKKNNIAPERFAFEITEQSMRETSKVVSVIHALRSRHFRIMIDDFGTGHSTLPNLRTLPVDTIKIDLSFMKDITSQTRDGDLVKSIIGFGKALNLEVVGKYVENKEQFIFLKQAGCSIAQGYFISKPLSSEQMLSLLEKENTMESLGKLVRQKSINE